MSEQISSNAKFVPKASMSLKLIRADGTEEDLGDGHAVPTYNVPLQIRFVAFILRLVNRLKERVEKW